jgi:hypothetical protein
MTATESAPVFFAASVRLLGIEKQVKEVREKDLRTQFETHPVGSRPTALRHPRQLQLPRHRGHLARLSGEKTIRHNQIDVLEDVALCFIMPYGFLRQAVYTSILDLVNVLPVAILETWPAVLGLATSKGIRGLGLISAI